MIIGKSLNADIKILSLKNKKNLTINVKIKNKNEIINFYIVLQKLYTKYIPKL